MKKNIILIILLSITTFILGLCVGGPEYKSALIGIKWTDMASILLTFFGFCFAFYTYHQWFNNKKKEDAYLIAKKYLSSIDQVQTCLYDLAFHYDSMCPAIGLVRESKKTTAQRIQHVDELLNELYKFRIRIIDSKRELTFWQVSLTDEFGKKHNELTEGLGAISTISVSLNSQINLYHLYDDQNINEVIRHKKLFDEKFEIVYEILSKRIDIGFEKVFTFK